MGVNVVHQYKRFPRIPVTLVQGVVNEQVGRYLNLETLPNYAVKHKMSYNGVKKHRHVQEIFKVKFVIDND